MTVACENVNSKLVEVVTLADVGDDDCVGNSLLQNWKLRFGQAQLLFRLVSRDADVWLRFGS